MTDSSDFILFAQHGWADTNQTISQLANRLATPKTLIFTPNLGFFQTWLRIEPLIEFVAKNAIDISCRYPNIPIRIIGHSMGGLIWLEVLDRYPQLRSRIESLILIASPIGGADLARLIDPFGIGLGIAKDLGINRRHLAEKIAQEIPTLVIAGDIDNGSDGTVVLDTTKFAHSKFVCLKGISHPALKNHPSLVEIIQDFWANPTINPPEEPDFTTLLIQTLRSFPGLIDGHRRDFCYSKPYIVFNNGIAIHTWRNPLQMEHIFLADGGGNCLYSGFVSWFDAKSLYQVLQKIKEEYTNL
jgi:hypothetical protein